jgi:DNA-binding FadR family transcriptional regulator
VDEAVDYVDDQELMRLEIQFHRRLIQCCDNIELDRVHESIHALFLTLQINGKTGRGERTVSHTDIVETIAAGDPVKAFEAMWQHMEGSAERWRAADMP